MLTIPIQVSGDVWNNRSDVKEMLDHTTPGQEIMLDLCSEGPSLRRLGIVDLISQYNLNVSITRWSNSIERVPYTRVECNDNSHFFPMSHHYWVDEIANTVPSEFRFALFQGRGCYSRNRILYDVFNQWSNQFLLSKMSSNHGDKWGTRFSSQSIDTEDVSQWFSDVGDITTWLNNCTIDSIDNYVIQDQYHIPEVSSGIMARSLFHHYPRFNVELVCETYTLGETFFPTEKTIRPMVGSRPFIVYGPKNYLKNLHQRGFRTFENCWDESYDQYEGPVRWQAMKELISNLVSADTHHWQNIINNTVDTTKHNRNLVRQIIRDLKGI